VAVVFVRIGPRERERVGELRAFVRVAMGYLVGLIRLTLDKCKMGKVGGYLG
jgi:hypothetical protein